VYVDDETDPGLAGVPADNEGVYPGSPDDVGRVVDPKVAGTLLLVGAVLIVFPGPVSSMIGPALVLVGAFIGAIEFLSPSRRSLGRCERSRTGAASADRRPIPFGSAPADRPTPGRARSGIGHSFGGCHSGLRKARRRIALAGVSSVVVSWNVQ
jgi:hypothetical protein